MQNFYRYALMMLKYRGRLAFGLSCALLSALIISAGLVLTLPVLRVVLTRRGEAGTAIDFREAVAHLDQTRFRGHIPDALIERIPHDVVTGLLLLMSIILCLTILGNLTRVVHAYISMRVCFQTTNDIRLMAFSRIMRMPLALVAQESISERASRMLRDTERINKGFAALVSRSFGYILKGLCFVIVAFIFGDWLLALLAILMLPVLLLVTRWFGKRIRNASRRMLKATGHMLNSIMQSFHGLRLVKAHTAERVEIGRLRRINAQHLRLDRPLRLGKALSAPTNETIGTIGFAMIAVFAGWRVFHGTTSGEEVGFTLLALFLAMKTLRPLTHLLNEMQEGSAAADRIAEIMAMPTERPQRGEPRKPHLPLFSDAIAFENVVFRYPGGDRPALRGINLVVDRGRTVAFVGPNGSGKTTLLTLVPRLYDPTQGRVLIDGHDIRDISLHSLRKQMGLVTQETILFQDTIANNIAYGNGLATREQIEQAARAAKAHDFIMAKPDGYDTLVGEHGLTLSGGERQRLAIARAILRNPAILILDEATSMIDAESEAQIAAALAEFCRQRTSLVIAHRLSTVVNADSIVVLDAGRIVDIGTHVELLGRCDLYRTLCRTQLVSETEAEEEIAETVPSGEAGGLQSA